MPAPLIVVSGVGTGVGKTHASVALLTAWSQGRTIAGYKPVETGVNPVAVTEGDDAWHLEQASTFHVKHLSCAVRFRAPVSPHLAARLEGRTLDVRALLATITRLRAETDGVLVELPGGLFSPLTERLLNFDFALETAPTLCVLVAPDRLGVLSDVIAAVRAAPALDFAILINAADSTDASSGTNAAELRLIQPREVYGPLPRRPAAELSRHPDLAALLVRAGAA